jgi:hypothetical protein
LYGYKEFFFNIFLARISKRFLSENRLARLIKTHNFEYIHALEIQGAGYLLLNSHFEKTNESPKIIITNWGSDIYYFEKNIENKTKIQKILGIADFYSAECHRDYELALRNGFKGKFLPINPNSGGFKKEVLQQNLKASSERHLIIAKCYGGIFGLGGLIIDALDIYLSINETLNVFLYSVTSDLDYNLKNLIKKYPGRINYSTVKNKLSLHDIYAKFAESRIYIGASRSDGISTSFLEALVLGAYPIQTNTSCANEWVEMGFKATLVSPEVDEIIKALVDNENSIELNHAREVNKNLAPGYLGYEDIKQSSLKFYDLN